MTFFVVPSTNTCHLERSILCTACNTVGSWKDVMVDPFYLFIPSFNPFCISNQIVFLPCGIRKSIQSYFHGILLWSFRHSPFNHVNIFLECWYLIKHTPCNKTSRQPSHGIGIFINFWSLLVLWLNTFVANGVARI